MSVGTCAVTLKVYATEKKLFQSAYPSYPNLVTLTVENAGISAAQLALIVSRGGVVVATASAFTGSTASATGSLDLHTTLMQSVMASVSAGAVRSFDMVLYDTSSLATVARGVMDVLGMAAYSASDAGAIIPVASTGLYFEEIDGINYFVLKDSAGVVYARFPAPGANP